MSIDIRKFCAAGLDIAAAQFVLVGKADGMDHEVEPPHSAFTQSNSASRLSSLATSHSYSIGVPRLAASGSTRFFSASP
jgi:hypothetical protein